MQWPYLAPGHYHQISDLIRARTTISLPITQYLFQLIVEDHFVLGELSQGHVVPGGQDDHHDPVRPQRWSIFQGDGMVNVFF